MTKLILNIIKYFISRITRLGKNHGNRYDQLYEHIKKTKPTNILEIGVYNAENAVKMINVNPKLKINYYGFDLFEDLDSENYSKEVAISPIKMQSAEKKILKKTSAKVNLYKVNTTKITEKYFKKFPKMDLIFIDGGHSIETQRNDWKLIQRLIKPNTFIFIDDCWNMPNSGSKFLIKEISKKEYLVKKLPIADYYLKKWGILKTQFLMIQKK